MSLCDDVIKYCIIPFVYHSDDFQILYRVPNKKFRRMVITELQQRRPGEILIRDTEHNLIQHLNFAEHTDLIVKKDDTSHNPMVYYAEQSQDDFIVTSCYYHIRPLVMYCNKPYIVAYYRNRKLVKIGLKFYSIWLLEHSNKIIKSGKYPAVSNIYDNYSEIRSTTKITTNQIHYHHYIDDEIVFEFHGFNSIKLKKRHLTTTKKFYRIRIDNHSSPEQGFQTNNARIRKILRDRSAVFVPANYVKSGNDRYFDCTFKFPGQIPWFITKMIKEIYYGDINKMLLNYKPMRVYNLYTLKYIHMNQLNID